MVTRGGMGRHFGGLLVAWAALSIGCGSGTPGMDVDSPGDAGFDVPADAPTDADVLVGDIQADIGGQDGVDEAAPDVADDVAGDVPGDAGEDVPEVLVPPEPAWVAPDERLRLATDRRDLPVPIGIPTAGYGQTPPVGSPKSPFAEFFMATTRQLHPPRVQVLHLMRGESRLVLVQTDLIAPFGNVFAFVTREVHRRTGADIADRLVLLANHTHLGPARYLDTPLGIVFADSYEEEVFQGIAGAIVDAVVHSMTTPAEPVQASLATLTEGRIHADRRCENPPHVNDTMGVLRFDTQDDDAPRTRAVVINYALHGTVYGWASGMISGDAPRSVELKVEEMLPGAPLVMFTQSWTGDVSPTDPRAPFADAPGPAAEDPALDRLEALGRLAGETILAAWDQEFEPMVDPALDIVSVLAPTSWDQMGYAPGEWDYPNGALLCGGGGSICSDTPPQMDQCLDIEAGWLPEATRFTAWRLGNLVAATLPGEPHTPLAELVIDGMRPGGTGSRDLDGSERAWVLGYAQDYIGYLMMPDDHAGGGYEASMAFWGPRQGEWVVRNAVAVAALLADRDAPLPFLPAAAPGWAPGPSVPYTPAVAVQPGTIVVDLPAQAVAGDVLSFSWLGGDPWIDRPEVVLEASEDGVAFEPLVSGGRVVDQRDYRVILSLEVTPDWKKSAPDGRTFRWTAAVRTGLKVPAPRTFLEGHLRVRASGQAIETGRTVRDYQVVSGASQVASEP